MNPHRHGHGNEVDSGVLPSAAFGPGPLVGAAFLASPHRNQALEINPSKEPPPQAPPAPSPPQRRLRRYTGAHPRTTVRETEAGEAAVVGETAVVSEKDRISSRVAPSRTERRWQKGRGGPIRVRLRFGLGRPAPLLPRPSGPVPLGGVRDRASAQQPAIGVAAMRITMRNVRTPTL